MATFTLRSLRPDDLDRVTEIENGLTGRSRRAFQEKRLNFASTMPESFITCAVVDRDRVAGYGYARVLHGEFGVKTQVGVLVDIGVDAAYHRKGLGRMVLAGIEQRMAKKGVTTLQTQADWADSRIIGFFAASGFSLGSGQIIERDTSPVPDQVAEVAPVAAPERHASHPTIRSLREDDLAAVVGIDTKLTGMNRFAYYVGNFREMLQESGIRVSLVAEEKGQVVGFIMARVDYGEFGKVDKAAVIDSIGVHPAFDGCGVGHALVAQLIANLASLKVETVRTKVDYANLALRSFLHDRGFQNAQRLLLVKELR